MKTGQMKMSRVACTRAFTVALACWFLLAWSDCSAQNGGLAFWEPKPETVKTLMRAARELDRGRYEVLRRAFVEAGCTGERLREETPGRHKEKSFLCVLPGQSADTILVMARYDQEAMRETGALWPDAVDLPLLFHALQATPHAHTFEFAEIGGSAAEKQFLESLRDPKAAAPVVQIVLNGIGIGWPFCSAPVRHKRDETAGEVNPGEDLCRVAYAVTQVMGLPPEPPPANDAEALTRRMRRYRLDDVRLFTRSPVLARVLLWSDYDAAHTGPWFAKDFDFVAWFLCRLDQQAKPATVSAVPNR